MIRKIMNAIRACLLLSALACVATPAIAQDSTSSTSEFETFRALCELGVQNCDPCEWKVTVNGQREGRGSSITKYEYEKWIANNNLICSGECGNLKTCKISTAKGYTDGGARTTYYHCTCLPN